MKELFIILGRIVLIATITVIIMLYFFNKGDKAEIQRLKLEKERHEKRADSLFKVSNDLIRKATIERVASEKRVKVLEHNVAIIDSLDRIEDNKYEGQLRDLRALRLKSSKEIQQIMITEYEANIDSLFH